jgi:hypothetical protein
MIFACQNSQQSEWQQLLQDKTLAQFQMLQGKGNWVLQNEVIIGTSEYGNPSSYLCTQEEYSDFILELDFMIDEGINSGVQIRSRVHSKDTTISYVSGKLEKQDRTFPKGSMYGYQIEIDPSDRAWSGGFYEEGGRGWLIPLNNNPAARQAYKPDEWNHFKIVAKGDSIKTWINGVQAVAATDSLFASGVIGFQLHKIYKEKDQGKQVKFRNIRIQSL